MGLGIRSYGISHKSNDVFTYKEREIWRHRDTQRQDSHMMTEGEIGVIQSQAKECQVRTTTRG